MAYSVTQIEFVRRLRQTGVTKEDVNKIWDELEQFDKLTSGIPSTTNIEPRRTVQIAAKEYAKLMKTNDVKILPKTVAPIPANLTPKLEKLDKMNDSLSITLLPIANGSSTKCPSPSQKSTVKGVNKSALSPLQPRMNLALGSKPKNYDEMITGNDFEDLISTPASIAKLSSSMCRANNLAKSHVTTMVHKDIESAEVYDNIDEEDPELFEFRKKGESAMLNDMRNFVFKHSIRQSQIAEATRVSQGYISRYFRSEANDMSMKTKRTLWLWYLKRKRQYELEKSAPKPVYDLSVANPINGIVYPTRKERFIFRKKHLDILEKYFKVNPYPDTHMKETIAAECNAEPEESGRRLHSSEMVNVTVVSNWFNNQRKERTMSRRKSVQDAPDEMDDSPDYLPPGPRSKKSRVENANESSDDADLLMNIEPIKAHTQRDTDNRSVIYETIVPASSSFVHSTKTYTRKQLTLDID